ncbi:MAG: methionyl-tRNA formyltransferase [Flavobacteriales bacterium]|nr:methionyl-tRNA formyltransferase [Flavobacteriales bacterium]
MRIVFLGTPDFAVASLKALIDKGFDVVGVVTMPDKKSGRGMKLQESAVKKFASAQGITVLQPDNLKDESFQLELRNLNPDLQIIVAFRMLPASVWQLPKYGTFNLHGSLLPNYRGAAPINWAIMNGETETGVTTFFLEHEIDTGEIIDNSKVGIGPNETAGELHNKLMHVGAELVVKTTLSIINGSVRTQKQEEILNGKKPKLAYKIFKETCKINWVENSDQIHNKIRGLSPHPAAFSIFKFPNGKEVNFKIFRAENIDLTLKPGEIKTDGKKELFIGCGKGSVKIHELQVAGKKRMPVQNFLQGLNLDDVLLVF